MHEYGIASSILESVLETAVSHGAKKVLSVRLRIGVLRGVVREHLEFFFDHLARGTVAEGCVLEVIEEPVSVTCEKCGEFEASEVAFFCPRCGGIGFRVEGGDSLHLEAVEIDA